MSFNPCCVWGAALSAPFGPSFPAAAFPIIVSFLLPLLLLLLLSPSPSYNVQQIRWPWRRTEKCYQQLEVTGSPGWEGTTWNRGLRPRLTCLTALKCWKVHEGVRFCSTAHTLHKIHLVKRHRRLVTRSRRSDVEVLTMETSDLLLFIKKNKTLFLWNYPQTILWTVHRRKKNNIFFLFWRNPDGFLLCLPKVGNSFSKSGVHIPSFLPLCNIWLDLY